MEATTERMRGKRILLKLSYTERESSENTVQREVTLVRVEAGSVLRADYPVVRFFKVTEIAYLVDLFAAEAAFPCPSPW